MKWNKIIKHRYKKKLVQYTNIFIVVQDNPMSIFLLTEGLPLSLWVNSRSQAQSSKQYKVVPLFP